jgi:hypothetical protein
MTDGQINVTIAEACGWRKEDGVYMWTANGIDYTCPDIWDWTNDLNAMHEAEKVLTKEQVRKYQNYMYDMACEINNTYGRWMPYSATARYRAEAFLKTLGKWEEEK